MLPILYQPSLMERFQDISLNKRTVLKIIQTLYLTGLLFWALAGSWKLVFSGKFETLREREAEGISGHIVLYIL